MSRESTNLAATVFGIAALSVIAGAVWFGVGADGSPPIPQTAAAASILVEDQPIRVHVSGAVAAPGVVLLPVDAIVADAVRAAGGAVSNANLAGINLAANVRAGERIVVPSITDAGVSTGMVEASGIDLNEHNAAQLESLPGVGPVLAARIVTYREVHGPFLTVEDLLDVPGIGESKLNQMRELIAYP